MAGSHFEFVTHDISSDVVHMLVGAFRYKANFRSLLALADVCTLTRAFYFNLCSPSCFLSVQVISMKLVS